MSDLKTRIQEDVKTAMKAGDKARLSLLRMLTAELKQKEVVESMQLTDAVVIASIEKMIKQRREAETQFRAGARLDLAEKEAQEIQILAGYLPQQLTDGELASLIEQAIRETGAAGIKDMGKVMGVIKGKAAGRADMGKVSALVKAKLAG